MADVEISPDEHIRLAVIAALSANERTAGLDLRVGVMNGIVHLAGSVPSLSLRQLAQDIISQAPGIRGVVNRIEAPGAPSPGRIINLDPSGEDASQDLTSSRSE
jgi:hypothetical protein